MKVAGLFSGIGGLELPFKKHGAETVLLCDNWAPAKAVLQHHFPNVPIHNDIRELNNLPADTDVVTAGFPCTDLSQAGRTAGIKGQESGLVTKIFHLLKRQSVQYVILENVRNMLVLDQGRAMTYLTREFEQLGYQWAYRLVDSRFTGVPHRRHRVIFVACQDDDPRRILFADNHEEPGERSSLHRTDAYGFYWTEGLTGVGWAHGAVPPLKGGSGLGIPSPPGVWLPNETLGRKIVTPTIEAAECLQGFEPGWTKIAETVDKPSSRWKLVGNAVTVKVSDWLIDRLFNPSSSIVESELIASMTRWPNAAYGKDRKVWHMHATCWPINQDRIHLTDILSEQGVKSLSVRATTGFLNRAYRSTLNFNEQFIADMAEHVEHQTAGVGESSGDYEVAAVAGV